MDLIPIQQKYSNQPLFAQNPAWREILEATIDFYKRVGFHEPWIGYFASIEGNPVGVAGFKGQPLHGTVEIAYGTFEPYQKQGIGTAICSKLVELSLSTDPSIRITARTLPDGFWSIRILEKNGFRLLGTVDDPDDGEVLEWEYDKTSTSTIL